MLLDANNDRHISLMAAVRWKLTGNVFDMYDVGLTTHQFIIARPCTHIQRSIDGQTKIS